MFDENLATRLVEATVGNFPGSTHVRHVGLKGAGDRVIWDYARQHGFLIVTKDADYHRFSVLYGPPPKVVWIRLGNCPTEDIIELLRAQQVAVEAFARHPEAGFLALG